MGFYQKILAVETSCDETAVAVLRGVEEVLFNSTYSQADIHAPYGGVVPEVASRNHLDILPLLVERALEKVSMKEVDLYAATVGPGLVSALMVGFFFTQALALGEGKPFIPINHMEGHLLSPFFGSENIEPHIALVVSGGHTLLFDVKGIGHYVILGKTLDDAAGEAFDKVAKFLGLPYPGGAKIDVLARSGDPARYAFPRPMLHSEDFNFSFSGLKTAIRIFLAQNDHRAFLPDLCASFQEAVVEVLVAKTIRAARAQGRFLVALSGGVSSNSRLQAKMGEACISSGIELRIANPALQTDNALMIAFAAAHRQSAGIHQKKNFSVAPHLDLASFCKLA